MKNILISGASSGFGEAVARRFSSDGYRLILLARRRERLVNLANELGGSKKCQLLCADVRNNGELKSALSALPEEFKNIDVLINNAGLALGMGPAEEASLKDWEVMVDTNIKGVIYLTRLYSPAWFVEGMDTSLISVRLQALGHILAAMYMGARKRSFSNSQEI